MIQFTGNLVGIRTLSRSFDRLNLKLRTIFCQRLVCFWILGPFLHYAGQHHIIEQIFHSLNISRLTLHIADRDECHILFWHIEDHLAAHASAGKTMWCTPELISIAKRSVTRLRKMCINLFGSCQSHIVLRNQLKSIPIALLHT